MMKKSRLTIVAVVAAIALLIVATFLFAPGAYADPLVGYFGLHFVPPSQSFFDYSKNWPTNFGPAYRDTALSPTNFVPCTGKYALCASSGPPPLPCRLTPDGRFANCACTVQTGINYVQMTSILNYSVYQQTVSACGADGSACFSTPDKAPVCAAIKRGLLIPGADLISDYNPDEQEKIVDLLNSATTAPQDEPPVTICSKAPYAGCMTAPCRLTTSGNAVCSCPIFWGIFQLTEDNAQCSLGNRLVWSASYLPSVDVQP